MPSGGVFIWDITLPVDEKLAISIWCKMNLGRFGRLMGWEGT